MSERNYQSSGSSVQPCLGSRLSGAAGLGRGSGGGVAPSDPGRRRTHPRTHPRAEHRSGWGGEDLDSTGRPEGQVRSGQVPGGPGSHLGSKARLLPGVLGALTVVAAPSTPVLFPLSLPLPLALPLLTDTGDSSVPTEFTVRRNILGEWIRALVRKPEKEGEELSSWLWLSLPCRRVGLRGKK